MRNEELGKSIFEEQRSRQHDELYLTAPPEEVKSNYVQATRIILEHYPNLAQESASASHEGSEGNALTMVDMGCATGDFVAFLDKEFPGQECLGVDYHSELVNAAETKYPQLQFRHGSILESSTLEPSSVDVLTVLGVLSMFDDIEPALKNCASWLRPGGILIVFNCFNPFPIDTWMRFERLDWGQGLEVGWNIPSQEKTRRILEINGLEATHFDDFIVDFDRAPSEDDPVRSWTVQINDKKMLINGLWILHPFKFLVATKAE